MKSKASEFEYQPQIDKWYQKNTKLSEPEELDIIEKYLNHNQIYPIEIKLSNDYVFNFYDMDSKRAHVLSLRPENVFKLSIYNITNKLQKYFFDSIEIDINFEKVNNLEAQNENKNIRFCSKHDILINLSKKSDSNNSRPIVIIFEYNEKKSHEKVYDTYKEIKSQFNSDLYLIYDEKKENNPLYNLKITIKKFIFDIFCFICTLTENKFILSKIIYFEDLENIDEEELETKTNIFNLIMDIKKNGKFDLKTLFTELSPYDPEDGTPYSYKQFVKLLNSDYKIDIKYNSSSTESDSEYFSKIILFTNTNISDTIYEYKQIYHEAINALENASEKIIQFNKKLLEKNECFQDYLKNYIQFDLVNNKSNTVLKKIYTKLKDKFD